MFVIDCSLTMAWLFEDEKSSYSEKIFDQLEDEKAIVPSIWLLEVINVLLISEKRKRITSTHTSHFINVLTNLPIQIIENNNLSQHESVLFLAKKHDLTAYDAAYLDLASKFGVPLATLDKALSKAAKEAGVPLL